MAEKTSEDNRSEILKLQRDGQEKQRDYYRQRMQLIFSWASSLLVGSVAGLFAITSGRGWSMAWPPDFGLRNDLVVATIALFTVYSIWWITGYGRKRRIAQKNMDDLERKLAEAKGLKLELLPKLDLVIQGSDWMCLGLLALAAIVYILLVHVNP